MAAFRISYKLYVPGMDPKTVVETVIAADAKSAVRVLASKLARLYPGSKISNAKLVK